MYLYKAIWAAVGRGTPEVLSNVSPWYYPPKPPPCTWYFQDPCARHPSSMMAGRTKRMSDLVNYLSIIHLLDMHTMPCTE